MFKRTYKEDTKIFLSENHNFSVKFSNSKYFCNIEQLRSIFAKNIELC